MTIYTDSIIAKRPELAGGIAGEGFQSDIFVFAKFVLVFVGAGVTVRAVGTQKMHVAELERTHPLVGVFVVVRVRVDALPVFVAVDGRCRWGGLRCRRWGCGMSRRGECSRDPAVGGGVHFWGAVNGCRRRSLGRLRRRGRLNLCGLGRGSSLVV